MAVTLVSASQLDHVVPTQRREPIAQVVRPSAVVPETTPHVTSSPGVEQGQPALGVSHETFAGWFARLSEAPSEGDASPAEQAETTELVATMAPSMAKSIQGRVI